MLIIATLAAALGIIGAGFTVAAASSAEEDKVLMDFSDRSIYEEGGRCIYSVNSSRFARSTEMPFSAGICCKYLIGNGGSGASLNLNNTYDATSLTGTDFTKYNTVNMWLYNGDAISADYAVKFYLYSGNDAAWANRAYVVIPRTWTGWKKFSFNLSEFKATSSFDPTNVSRIQFMSGNTDGTNVTYTPEQWSCCYIDRIWLSDTNPGYLLLDSAKCESYKIKDTTTAAFEKDYTAPYYNDYSVKSKLTQGQMAILYNDASNVIDASRYSHISFAMYSDKVTTEETDKNTRIRFYFYSTDNGWYQWSFDIDWTGWKYFSVPLDKITIGGTSTATAFKDCTTVKGFRIYCEKDTLSPKLNFSRIALINGEAAPLTAGEFSVEDNAQNIQTPTNKVALSYNNALAEYVNKDNVTVSVNGVALESGFTVGTKANTVEIFLGDMKPASTYTVTVNGATDIYGQANAETKAVTFNTIERELELDGDISFATQAGDTLTALKGASDVRAKVNVKNNSNRDRRVNVIVAVYDAAGKLEKVTIEERTVKESAVTQINDVGVTVSPAEGSFARAFVWKNALTPVYGSSGKLPYEAE